MQEPIDATIEAPSAAETGGTSWLQLGIVAGIILGIVVALVIAGRLAQSPGETPATDLDAPV
jgi:hypothetical protein